MLNFNPSNIVSKSRTIGRRMFLISAVKGIVIFGVFARLVSLQITESNKYQSLSDRNRFREWKLAPPRGVIKDYFGKELATNEKIYLTGTNANNCSSNFMLLQKIQIILKDFFLN